MKRYIAPVIVGVASGLGILSMGAVEAPSPSPASVAEPFEETLVTVSLSGVPLSLRVGAGCSEVRQAVEGRTYRVSACAEDAKTLAIEVETLREREGRHDAHNIRVRAARTGGETVTIATLPGLEATLKTN